MSSHLPPLYSNPANLAGEALTRGQAVKFDGSGENLVSSTSGVSSAGGRSIGFVQQDTASGKPASVAHAGGGAVGIAAGTIAKGNSLKSDDSGHLLPTSTTDDIVIAIADDSAVDGDVFAIRPCIPTRY